MPDNAPSVKCEVCGRPVGHSYVALFEGGPPRWRCGWPRDCYRGAMPDKRASGAPDQAPYGTLPPFEGNPLKSAPDGAHVRVWTQAGGFEHVGRFTGPTRFTTDNGRMTLVGESYCRIENADTGEVYYDNGWYR